MQYHGTLSRHLALFTKYSDELAIGERRVHIPFADSQNESFILKSSWICRFNYDLRHLNVEWYKHSVLIDFTLGYVHVGDEYIELLSGLLGLILILENGATIGLVHRLDYANDLCSDSSLFLIINALHHGDLDLRLVSFLFSII
jgi:hypothetical protein